MPHYAWLLQKSGSICMYNLFSVCGNIVGSLGISFVKVGGGYIVTPNHTQTIHSFYQGFTQVIIWKISLLRWLFYPLSTTLITNTKYINYYCTIKETI